MKIALLVISSLLLIKPLRAEQPGLAPKRIFKESAAMAADRMLQDKVREALTGGFFSKGYEYIQVFAKDGVVQLKGTVLTKKDKTIIEGRLKKIAGIVRVDDQIEVSK